MELIVKSELVRVMQQHKAIGRTERKVNDIEVWYPDEYVGLQKCHFRSLYCVCPETVKKAFEQKIPLDQHEKLKELVANNAEGDIFWVRQQAWVSLTLKPISLKTKCVMTLSTTAWQNSFLTSPSSIFPMILW